MDECGLTATREEDNRQLLVLLPVVRGWTQQPANGCIWRRVWQGREPFSVGHPLSCQFLESRDETRHIGYVMRQNRSHSSARRASGTPR